jgi:hypothetical protein
LNFLKIIAPGNLTGAEASTGRRADAMAKCPIDGGQFDEARIV